MVNIVSRAQWGARPPKSSPTAFARRDGVSFHWQGPPMGAYPVGVSANYVRGYQNHHMNTNGWNDIAYNYLINRYGEIFEGRGFNARSAANGTNDSNARYIAICFMFGKGDTFTPEMQRAGRDLRNWLRGRGVGFDTRDHSRFVATECSGDPVRVWVAQGCPASDTPLVPLPNIKPISVVTDNDWLEGVVMSLPTLDLRAAGSIPVRSHLVDNLQGLLTATMHGPSDPKGIDGIAGQGTLDAVRGFQAMKGLSVDGIVGPDTWRALITH